MPRPDWIIGPPKPDLKPDREICATVADSVGAVISGSGDHPNAPELPDLLGQTAAAYARACANAGLPGGWGGVAGALDRYRAFYRKGLTQAPYAQVNLPPVMRAHESGSSEGRVLKFVLPVPGREGAPGQTLETESVIIPMIGKKGVRTHTLCVSSQVGCAMGCTFCQTAQMGLLRNLTAREIVQQWVWARTLAPRLLDGSVECEPGAVPGDPVLDPVPRDGLREHKPEALPPAPSLWEGESSIRNVVFMGMGEPMDNLDAVLDAISVLTDHNGVNLPMSKVTISTVGRVDGILRLAERVRRPGWHRLNLAVSLNAPNDEVRARIMPVNRKYPMGVLREAIEAWPIYGAAKICFEYVLIPGVNDQPEHARELGDFVLGRGLHSGRPPLPGLVNLIPYNPREGSPWPAPDEGSVELFLAQLLEAGVYAKRRRTKGRDTMAACGQLGNPALRRRPVRVSVGGVGD